MMETPLALRLGIVKLLYGNRKHVTGLADTKSVHGVTTLWPLLPARMAPSSGATDKNIRRLKTRRQIATARSILVSQTDDAGIGISRCRRVPCPLRTFTIWRRDWREITGAMELYDITGKNLTKTKKNEDKSAKNDIARRGRMIAR
jgi:hypothetical protein